MITFLQEILPEVPLREVEEAVHHVMPTWFQMFLALVGAIGTTFGGFELVKWLLSIRANRKKDQAEAKKEEALAKQEESHAKQDDTDWRQKELDLMTSFVNTAKEQFEDLTKRYDECRKDKAEMLSAIRRFEQQEQERDRKIEGLQRAFTEEVARRKLVERFYCSNERCKVRRPPLGTYSSDEPEPQVKKRNRAPAKKLTPSLV